MLIQRSFDPSVCEPQSHIPNTHNHIYFVAVKCSRPVFISEFVKLSIVISYLMRSHAPMHFKVELFSVHSNPVQSCTSTRSSRPWAIAFSGEMVHSRAAISEPQLHSSTSTGSSHHELGGAMMLSQPLQQPRQCLPQRSCCPQLLVCRILEEHDYRR